MLSIFDQQYVHQVRTINAEQGKNGVYLGYGVRTIVAIRSILLQSNTKYSVEIMDSNSCRNIILNVWQKL